MPFGSRSVNSRRICSASPDADASSRSTAIRPWASSRSERVSSYRSAKGRSAATCASSLRSSAFAFQATAEGQAIPSARAATAAPARIARETPESDPSRGGESRSIRPSPSAAPNAPRRANGSGAEPPSPGSGQGGDRRPVERALDPEDDAPVFDPPSLPSRTTLSARSGPPAHCRRMPAGRQGLPARARDLPPAPIPARRGGSRRRTARPRRTGCTPPRRPPRGARPPCGQGQPDGPPGPDRAAPTAHAAGTAADSERPARVTISSHRSM